VFAGVVLDLGLGIAVCWPPAPQQKGAIENLVGWVKGSFFKQRRFLDHEDLLTQLAAWLREVNPERPSRATGVVPAVLADVFNSLLIAVRQFDATAPILKDPSSTIRFQRRRVGC
jgi:hypothetical protein